MNRKRKHMNQLKAFIKSHLIDEVRSLSPDSFSDEQAWKMSISVLRELADTIENDWNF